MFSKTIADDPPQENGHKDISTDPDKGGRDEVYIHSHKPPLPIKTVEEVIAEAGEETPWIIEDLLARGALTDFAGVAKDAGKTTFWCHGIEAGARGEDHGGFFTTGAKYLYLTEQGNNFSGALEDSGLAEYSEFVRVLQFKDVPTVPWDTLMRQAASKVKHLGFDALIVDTFTVFARLKGAEENDVGPVADRMRVLRAVAQQHDIGVVLIRHSGKDGTPRGSSAFEAEADICITIAMPEGRHPPTVCRLRGKGRYGIWERNIELKDGRYISLGSDNRIEFNKVVQFIKVTLLESPEVAIKRQELLDRRGPEDISNATLKRALTWLVKQGDGGEKQLVNERGKPKVYWLAYKPPGGFDHYDPPQREFDRNKPNSALVSENFDLDQTTTHSYTNDRNKPRTDKRHDSADPESEQNGSKEGKVVGTQPATLSHSAKGATAPQSAEQGNSENDVVRDDDARSFRIVDEVFEEFDVVLKRHERQRTEVA
jgi:hypothetical protein